MEPDDGDYDYDHECADCDCCSKRTCDLNLCSARCPCITDLEVAE